MTMLAELGQVYVTRAAAQRFAELRKLASEEEGRRQLTELLLDGTVKEDGPPMKVRARSRATQLDITARVVREGRLLVVVACEVRDYL